MPLITFEEAWRAYREAEKNLPAKPRPTSPVRVGGLLDVIDRFDLVLLDAWGVLNLGEAPIPSARKTVAGLRSNGVPLRVLSNDASTGKLGAVERHRRRGYDFAPEEIVAGLDLVPAAVRDRSLASPVGLIADVPAPAIDVSAPLHPLADEAEVYGRVSGFVFLSSDDWSESRQSLLRASLAWKPRSLIVGNPDIASPGSHALAAEPGYYAHRLAGDLGIHPCLCGKPDRAIYDLALAAFPQIPRERVLCIGDTLHTDILGARAAGCRAMLVEDGFCAGRDALALAADCAIWPDFIAPGI